MTGLEKDLQATYEELGRIVSKRIRLEMEEARVIEKLERLERDFKGNQP